MKHLILIIGILISTNIFAQNEAFFVELNVERNHDNSQKLSYSDVEYAPEETQRESHACDNLIIVGSCEMYIIDDRLCRYYPINSAETIDRSTTIHIDDGVFVFDRTTSIITYYIAETNTYLRWIMLKNVD
jgi:hypothetical protein